MTDYTELIERLRSCSRQGTRYGIAVVTMADAAAAIEDMAKHITEMHERVTVLQIARGELEAEVKRLEPKCGKWIKTEEMEWGIYPFKKKTCSVCDCKIDHIFMLACMDYFDDRDTVFHYCPNCGAKMREVQE